jgi:hypothetical protein
MDEVCYLLENASGIIATALTALCLCLAGSLSMSLRRGATAELPRVPRILNNNCTETLRSRTNPTLSKRQLDDASAVLALYLS